MDNYVQHLLRCQDRTNQAIRQNPGTPNAVLRALQAERESTQELLNRMQEHGNQNGNAPLSNRGHTMLGTVGRAIEWGAGFGIGEDLINKIL